MKTAQKSWKSLSLCAVTALSVVLAAPGSAQASPRDAQGNSPIIMSQGDPIITKLPDGENTLCTVGFVNGKYQSKRASSILIMSGHCAQGKTGVEVLDENFHPIGRVSHNWYDNKQKKDISVVELNEDVIAGGNSYSGDTWVLPEKISIGDPICSRGAASDSVHCGEVIDVKDNLVRATRTAGGIEGDSGGPAWIPGKGFVGVFFGGNPHRSVFVHPNLYYRDSMVRKFQISVEKGERLVKEGLRSTRKNAEGFFIEPMRKFLKKTSVQVHPRILEASVFAHLFEK